MKRLLGLSALIMFAATGCRMCACPYDYCGPVVECGCMGGEGGCGCGCGGSAGPTEGQGAMEEGAPMEGETISSPENPQPAPAPANMPTSSNRSGSRRVQQAGYSTR